MKLVSLSSDAIRIGSPLPFSLRDAGGVLLAPKGFVVPTQAALEQVISQRGQLFIDMVESEAHRKAYVNQLRELVQEDIPLGQIAESQFASFEMASVREKDTDSEPDWLALQEQAHAMLRDRNPVSFLKRLDELQRQLNQHARQNPDGALFALTYLTNSELRMYSATHAMLVAVMCSLAVRDVLKWPEGQEALLCKAALTMNLGMTELQDRLAQQKEPPNPEQRHQIQQHPVRSVVMLEQYGVTDQAWLEAVLDHHSKIPGPLLPRTLGQKMARLIQRADLFAACLAPRAARLPATPATAMQACYFDENREIDEAGAALVKTMGIYSPGSFVRLSSNELAVVVRRAANSTAPRVAIVVNRSGMPTVDFIVRDTRLPEFKIVASVAHREVKVKINLERMLALTKPVASDRPW